MTDLDEVYSKFSGTVTSYLLRLCGNQQLAEELTQETFYQAVRCIGRFDGKSSISTWLCSIARHLYYDYLRKQKPTVPVTDTIPSPEDFTDRIENRDQAMHAHRVLHALEEPFREVFTLRTFCDLSHSQIAELFGKSESWSRITYFRARQMLQKAIREDHHEKE
jgi:RNA polymerase sigma-70 factor (ECF subfamily)